MDIRNIVDVQIAAPVERVWSALREPREIARWFGWQHADLGSEIDFIFGTDARVIEAGRSLRLMGIDTTFALEPRGAGCGLRVCKPGSPAEPAPYDEIEDGWVCFAQQLRFALERHPGEERRTLRLAPPSHATPDGVPFGPFAQLARKAIGTRYELDAGAAIAGEVWSIAEYQLGLTLDGAGEGLLMVARTPAQGLSSAIVTTYGLSDDAFEALRSRWNAWWQALAEPRRS